MKERIRKYMDYKSISAGELAAVLDVQRSNISHILNGRNKPGAVFIEKMLNEFPDIDARWLLTGEGSMIIQDVESKTGQQQKLPLTPQQEAAPELIKEVVPKEEPVELPQKEEEKEPIKEMSSVFPFISPEVESIILLYRDGSFTTYNNRRS